MTSVTSDDLAEGVEAYVEQQQGQCISSMYPALNVFFAQWPGVDLQICFPQPHRVCDEGYLYSVSLV